MRALFAYAVVAAAFAIEPAAAQGLPRLHITALGMHADKAVAAPGESFHVTIHVHVREKRDRLDELVLPALSNVVDLGDERRRVAVADGTDFYEILTVAGIAAGPASFSPAYIDAIDPATGHGMRYSSQPLDVRISGDVKPDANQPPAYQPFAAPETVRGVLIGAIAFALLAGFALVLFVRRMRRRIDRTPVAPQCPPIVIETRTPPADPIRAALADYRALRNEASLDGLRALLFARAGAGRGATLADALRALGSRDPALGRIIAVAERARFGPNHDRGPAGEDLLAMLETYLATEGSA